jgi:hypothetical protein
MREGEIENPGELEKESQERQRRAKIEEVTN